MNGSLARLLSAKKKGQKVKLILGLLVKIFRGFKFPDILCDLDKSLDLKNSRVNVLIRGDELSIIEFAALLFCRKNSFRKYIYLGRRKPTFDNSVSFQEYGLLLASLFGLREQLIKKVFADYSDYMQWSLFAVEDSIFNRFLADIIRFGEPEVLILGPKVYQSLREYTDFSFSTSVVVFDSEKAFYDCASFDYIYNLDNAFKLVPCHQLSENIVSVDDLLTGYNNASNRHRFIASRIKYNQGTQKFKMGNNFSWSLSQKIGLNEVRYRFTLKDGRHGTRPAKLILKVDESGSENWELCVSRVALFFISDVERDVYLISEVSCDGMFEKQICIDLNRVPTLREDAFFVVVENYVGFVVTGKLEVDL